MRVSNKPIGNTIPTNLSFVLGEQIIKFFKQKKYFYFQQQKPLLSRNIPHFQKINSLNYGELGECGVKAQLLCFKNQYIRTVLGYIQKFENKPDQLIQNKKLTLFQLYRFTNSERMQYFIQNTILKSKNNSKADIFINNRGVSMKILEKGPPTIINHTHRENFLRVLDY